MKSYVAYDLDNLLHNFFTAVVEMSNADFTLSQIISEYIEYRERGVASLDIYLTYGPSLSDKEDGIILHAGCLALYQDLDRVVQIDEGRVTKVMLNNEETEILLEITL